MRLRFNQLRAHAQGPLAPVYLVCGDEPWQLGEAASALRAAARAQGFTEREVLDQDGNFDWSLLAASASAMSLFAERKQIELRLGSAKIGAEGSAAIRAYCERPCPDNLLLVIAPALDRKELDAAWVKAIDGVGALVQVWPLKGTELTRWLGERLTAAGLIPGEGVAELIAERSEGNLLAAVQEVEKLALLREPGPLAVEDLLGNLADSARFDVFALSDAALAGDRARVARVLAVLQAEGTAHVLVLWTLARDIRMLAEAAAARAARRPLGPVLSAHRVPRMREEAVGRALGRLSPAFLRRLLQRCLEVDLAIKGQRQGDPWQLLAVVADALARGPAQGRAG